MDIQTSNTNNLLKYKHEELSSNSEEYKFVKNFFDTTKLVSEFVRQMPTDFKVYNIIENQPTKVLSEKRKNLMLFHGTSSKGIEGILKEGFKNSVKGLFGKGVYMTDCSSSACYWSNIRMEGNENSYIFVNEVLESEKLLTFEHESSTQQLLQGFQHSTPKHPFEKHEIKQSHHITELDYKEDDLGRRYRNVPHNLSSYNDEYIADESLVVPRYLIIFK